MEASIGAKAGFFGSGAAWEVSLKVGYTHTWANDKGQSVAYTIPASVVSGSYILAEAIDATEFIIDVYDARGKQ
ncbi:MAG: hypothetical protein LBF68_07880 [Christensenellaceae bacterium]|nr:hypothetical protein [Christensenellaceae bacterium]